jgi:hypothetical protein
LTLVLESTPGEEEAIIPILLTVLLDTGQGDTTDIQVVTTGGVVITITGQDITIGVEDVIIMGTGATMATEVTIGGITEGDDAKYG